ncbi:MAG: glycosyltransferase [Mycobacteriales bacterium]
MSAKPRVVVVVPTHNRAHLWPKLAECLARQDWQAPFEIVAVDDASRDDTQVVLKQLASRMPNLRSLRLPKQGGPSVARNVGWQSAQADVVAFTDDDCLPEPGWVSSLVAALDRLDVAQGLTAIDHEGGERGAFSVNVEVREFNYYFQTCNIAYRRKVLERLGGFDEAYGHSRGGAPNGEDLDLGWRALEAGFECGFAAEAVVRHPYSRSSFWLRLKSRLRTARVVYAVRRHPGMREHFPHPMFFQESHEYAVIPLLAVPLATTLLPWVIGVPIALASFVPYVRYRQKRGRLAGRRRYFPVTIPAMWLIDAADVLVLVVASVRWRTLLL